MIEPLESRIAPAATFTYIDVDGDLVTIVTSKGTNADLNEASGVLTFSASDPGEPNVPRQLLKIDLSGPAIGGTFNGTDLTITARRGPAGDGLVNVGYIDAAQQILGNTDINIDLGKVIIGGDLGAIDCGALSAFSENGMKLLSVRSMGVFGTATQLGGDLHSEIAGGIGALKVTGDIKNAHIEVTGGTNGKIGTITIGGSLIGGSADSSGSIEATGDIGKVNIRGDILGGDGNFSGSMSCVGKIASLTINGSILGGQGNFTGVGAAAGLGPVKIGRDVVGFDGLIAIGGGAIASVRVSGSVLGFVSIGGSSGTGPVRVVGDLSGSIQGDLTSVTIGGSVLGGTIGSTTGMAVVKISGSVIDGAISTQQGTLASVKIGRDFIGSTILGGDETQAISVASIGVVTIGGSFLGKGATGRISATNGIGSVKIAGSMIGDGDDSATIRTFETNTTVEAGIGSITIGGSLIGGAGLRSGHIECGREVGQSNTPIGNLGPVSIRGSVLGGDGAESGFIRAAGKIAGIKIGGSLVGGAEANSGKIFTIADLGAVSIRGDVRGGAGGFSGLIDGGSIASLTLGGSLVGGSGDLSGAIFSLGDIGPVKVGRDLRGGSIEGAQLTLDRSGYLQGGRIASVTIGGSIVAGVDDSTGGSLTKNASIRAADDIGAITVKGSIAGNSTANGVSRIIISARGQETLGSGATSDIAIKSLTVGGRIELALILGGYVPDDPLVNGGTNGNASIGAVKVGGDWIASTIAAGVRDTGNDFGNIDDEIIPGATLVARIASITIKGVVIGSTTGSDHFAFTAAQIGAFQAASFTAALTTGTDAPIELSLATGDVTVREV